MVILYLHKCFLLKIEVQNLFLKTSSVKMHLPSMNWESTSLPFFFFLILNSVKHFIKTPVRTYLVGLFLFKRQLLWVLEKLFL